MSNADRVMDIPIELEFNGKKYKLHQITAEDYAEVERTMRTLYIGEVAKSLRMAGISEDKIIEAVQKLQFERWGVKGNSQKEREKYYNEKIRPLLESTEAISHILYLSLKKANPEVTLDDAKKIIASNPDRMEDIITYVMGGEVRKSKNPPQGKR